MSTKRRQTLEATYVAVTTTTRRRSVPTRPSTPMPRSLQERWRERPRCRARHLTPRSSDGVVHAIASRRPCPSLRARSMQENRAACLSICVARSGPKHSAGIVSRTCQVLPQNMRTISARIEPHHHRADDADAVLDVVNALRFAPTRPVAGPSGIDDASARHRWAMTRWWIDLMRRTTRLTTTSRGRILTSFRQCRTALLRSATMASGARIPPMATRARFGAHPSQHRSLLQDYRPAVDLHTVGCELHGFSRRRVLRTTRRNEAAFTRA